MIGSYLGSLYTEDSRSLNNALFCYNVDEMLQELNACLLCQSAYSKLVLLYVVLLLVAEHIDDIK